MFKRRGSRKGGQGRPKRRRLVSHKSWDTRGYSSRKFTRGRPSKAVIPSTVGGPDSLFLKLRTNAIGSITCTSGAFQTTRGMKLNSCVDPLGTQGSISSVGFAQYCSATAPYRSYIVHSVQFKVRFSTIGTSYMRVAVCPMTNAATAPSNWQEAAGQARSRLGFVTNPTQGGCVLGGYYNIGELVGQNAATVQIDDTFAALYNADPTSLAVVNISAQPIDATTTVVQYFDIELIQYVQLYDRNVLT